MAYEQAPRSVIAGRNDAFRRAGGIMVTLGVMLMPDMEGLLQAVRDYDDFTSDNDPNREHDFGAILWLGEQTYWKIDYYDQSLRYWCDPASDDCQRVLTVMLGEEY